MDIIMLRKVLAKVFERGLKLSFFLPHSDVRNPTWEELRNSATEAYALALGDVLDAIDGDTSALKEAISEGRLFCSHSDRDFFLERLEQMAKEPHPEWESED